MSDSGLNAFEDGTEPDWSGENWDPAGGTLGASQGGYQRTGAGEADLPRSFGPSISYMKVGHGGEVPGPQFRGYLDSPLKPPAGPKRDFDGEEKALRGKLNDAQAEFANVKVPDSPSGYARSGPEGLAAAFAILGNLLDKRHRAGTAGYTAFHSGVARAQNGAYHDSLSDANTKQQLAQDRAKQILQQIEQLKWERLASG